MTSDSRLDELRAEARYHRERYDLARARAYGGHPKSATQMRELARAYEVADERRRAAECAARPPASGAGA